MDAIRVLIVEDNDDDALLLAVNPDNDTLSIITTNNNTKVGTVSFAAGSMPVSVVIHPNNTEAYVVLRKAQKLPAVEPRSVELRAPRPVGN